MPCCPTPRSGPSTTRPAGCWPRGLRRRLRRVPGRGRRLPRRDQGAGRGPGRPRRPVRQPVRRPAVADGGPRPRRRERGHPRLRGGGARRHHPAAAARPGPLPHLPRLRGQARHPAPALPDLQRRGTVTRDQGLFGLSSPCPTCQGRGSVIDDPCPTCNGRGSEVRTRELKVRIPTGVNDGATVRLKGQGEPGQAGAPAGDLIVKVRVTPHPLFGRSGQDLTITVPVTFAEAALGTELKVPTLDGPVTLKVPAGTQNGRTFRVRGRGVPGAGRKGAGDLLVSLQVAVPEKLSRKERDLLRSSRRCPTRRPGTTSGSTERGEDHGGAAGPGGVRDLGRGRAGRGPPPDAADLRAGGAGPAQADHRQRPPLLRAGHRAAAGDQAADRRRHEPGRGPAGHRAHPGARAPPGHRGRARGRAAGPGPPPPPGGRASGGRPGATWSPTPRPSSATSTPHDTSKPETEQHGREQLHPPGRRGAGRAQREARSSDHQRIEPEHLLVPCSPTPTGSCTRSCAGPAPTRACSRPGPPRPSTGSPRSTAPSRRRMPRPSWAA